jgi:hypothetical protein
MILEMQMSDDEYMIGWLAGKIHALGVDFVVQFVDTPRDQLVKYHNSLGRMIRNEFKMWEENWTPRFVNGVDVSPDHPEQRSQLLIEQTWEQVQ